MKRINDGMHESNTDVANLLHKEIEIDDSTRGSRVLVEGNKMQIQAVHVLSYRPWLSFGNYSSRMTIQ